MDAFTEFPFFFDPWVMLSQIFGFLLFFLLLKNFLFDRILRFVQDRDREIASKQGALERERKELEERKGEYDRRIREVQGQAYQKLQRMVREAVEEKNRLLAEAHAESLKTLEQAVAEIERQRETARSEIEYEAERLGEEVTALLLESGSAREGAKKPGV